MDIKKTFGETLKDLREARGLGQVVLAKSIGVSKGIISLWENGLREPTMSNLVSLARYFDVSVDEIIGLK